MPDVLLGGVHGEAVVDADIFAVVLLHDLSEAAHAAARVQDALAAQIAQREVEAGLQAVARVVAAGETIELGVPKALPLVAEAAGVRVLLHEPRHAAHHW